MGSIRQDWLQVSAYAPPCGVLFGFAFGLFEGGAAMSCIVEALWICAGLVVVGLTWFGTAQNCQVAREAKERDERLASMPDEIIRKLADGDLLEELVRSKQSAVDKIANVNRYVVAAHAFGLVEEITRYLENNKLVHLPRLGPFMRALRGPIPWDQTPEATMARAYKETFGDRLRALVEQFREIGIELPQRDEAYFAPGMYSWVELSISQIKDAANRLVGDLARAAGMRVAGPEDTVNYSVNLQASVGKPAASVQTTLIRGTTAKPEDES